MFNMNRKKADIGTFDIKTLIKVPLNSILSYHNSSANMKRLTSRSYEYISNQY